MTETVISESIAENCSTDVCTWSATLNHTILMETTIVHLVSFPILFCICIAGNIFTIVIFSTYHTKNVREVLLITLAASDMMLM